MRAKPLLAALMTTLMTTFLAAALPAAAQTWSITVTSSRTVQTSDLQRSAPNQITGTQATVQVTCQTAADCDQVGLQLERNGAVFLALGRVPAGSNTFPVPAAPVAGTVADLAVTFQGQKIDSFQVTAASPGGTTTTGTTGTAGTTTAPSASAPSLAEMITTVCPSSTVTVAYDARANQGEILVTPAGNVLARGLDTFDENDTLKVIVYGDARLLPMLKVERTSAFRDVQTVRIVGAGTTLPAGFVRQGAGVCTTAEFRLADFAPGQAKVQISAFQNDNWLPLGTFDFNVDPLYTGMFSLGAAWTDAVDPGYKVASNGTQTVIALGDDGKNDLLYTLFYTPFVWGKRDLEKKVPWYQRINPTIGVVPEDIDENALIGVSLDLPAGFVLTFGKHFRRITVLPSDTGLAVGSPFSGTADQLPTAQSWEDETFFAVTVDLRAMAQLLTAALSGGSGNP